MTTRENLGALIGLLISRDLAEVGGDETSTVTSRVCADDPRGSPRSSSMLEGVSRVLSSPGVRELFLSRGGRENNILILQGRDNEPCLGVASFF
jgi:hypothetical protein